MPDAPWSDVAPIGPYQSDILQLPVSRRDKGMELLSRLASPKLRHRPDAIRGAASRPRVLVAAIRKVGLTVTLWLPKGTVADWGDTNTDAATAADGDVTHVYGGAGTYTIVLTNATTGAQGRAVVTV